MEDIARIDVIAPNFKRRLSGVTSTVVRLVPIQAGQIAIAAAAPALPPNVPQVAISSLIFMSRRGPSGHRVWHARRNIEMLAGLALKVLLRKRLKLLFTSASQRHHTGFTKWLISKMDSIVSTSERTATYLDRPSTVILHGIDSEAFTPIMDKAPMRRVLGLPAETRLVGCFGRIREHKGTGDFVEAMVQVLQDRPGVTALVMGRATDQHRSFEAGLHDRAAEAGLGERIRFLPEVPVWQMPDWYRVLDLYVAPQRWEGFGLTPLEAMSCGVPVLATRVGAFEEQLEDGVTGRLVPPEDVPALAREAADLLDDMQTLTRMGSAARERVKSHFRIEDEAAALVSIYRDLLDRD